MSWFHKKPEPIPYDREKQQPAVRRSICTGEMTAGFLDRDTGKFRELMLLDGQKELEAFCQRTGVEERDIKTIY
ncbi:MAG: aspartate dehydrogenase [Oscillibacter sp.]|nr:aspartate dehydrogenase [Oscillibacter sp.]